jgi:DNA-binding MarR family transcriptional regulator
LTLAKATLLTRTTIAAIKVLMTEALSRRLKQAQFANPGQAALLSVLVAAATLNERMERLCERFKITHAQYNVLRILRGVYPEGHPRCEIARRMLDRASDVTRLTNRLEARHLVKRFRGSEDQRQTVTYITPKGIKLLDSMLPDIEAETSGILQHLSTDDCHELSRLCELIFDSEDGEPTWV